MNVFKHNKKSGFTHQKIRNFSGGFTLIELLVVIAIISLLSSVILASLNTARVKARDATRASNVRQLKLAIEFYYNDNGFYPSVGADDTGYTISILATPLSAYIKTIPNDPLASQSWSYVRGGAANNSYGFLIYTEKSGWCGSGVNFNSGWWGIGSNMCPF